MENRIEHLFRYEYSKIVAALVSKFSAALIDEIEDSVQESLLKGMQIWQYKDLPDNPSGWLYKTSYNKIIDTIRRNKRSTEFDYDIDIPDNQVDADDFITSGIKDQQLKMIFACCHPLLESTEQIMLSLKLLCGFSLKEIGSALLKNDEAVKKAISRAKKKFKNEIGYPEIPNENELNERLDAVLTVIYLLFNEGYKATDGEKLIKKDVCFEAIRLAELLTDHDTFHTAELDALIALMYYNAARFNARIDAEGILATLDKQDRTKWNKGQIELAGSYLQRASKSELISRYHIEAAIASIYSNSKYDEIDWGLVLKMYDLLIQIDSSPVVKLNRIVAMSKVVGPVKADHELDNLKEESAIEFHYLFYTIKADLQSQLGQISEALKNLQKAISLTSNKVEIEFLKRKIIELHSIEK